MVWRVTSPGWRLSKVESDLVIPHGPGLERPNDMFQWIHPDRCLLLETLSAVDVGCTLNLEGVAKLEQIEEHVQYDA
jgi:hypothetical protein